MVYILFFVIYWINKTEIRLLFDLNKSSRAMQIRRNFENKMAAYPSKIQLEAKILSYALFKKFQEWLSRNTCHLLLFPNLKSDLLA